MSGGLRVDHHPADRIRHLCGGIRLLEVLHVRASTMITTMTLVAVPLGRVVIAHGRSPLHLPSKLQLETSNDGKVKRLALRRPPLPPRASSSAEVKS